MVDIYTTSPRFKSVQVFTGVLFEKVFTQIYRTVKLYGRLGKALCIVWIRSCSNCLGHVADSLSNLGNICGQIFYNTDKSRHYSL